MSLEDSSFYCLRIKLVVCLLLSLHSSYLLSWVLILIYFELRFVAFFSEVQHIVLEVKLKALTLQF